MPSGSEIKALLFDLGGVVLRIDFKSALNAWAPYSRLSPAAMAERAVSDEAFRRHERGQLDSAGYFAHLREVFELDASDEQIGAGWNAILIDEYALSMALIRQARAHLPCYAFTNTGAYHYDTWSTAFPDIVSLFDRIFMSFEMGLRKPEKAAFDAVATAIGMTHSEILFFDDTDENIEGARNAGLQTVKVNDPADIQRALTGIGICDALSQMPQ